MFFWAKPADGTQWIEIPPANGKLVRGVYNIAVQSPQPHFTVVTHLRHYHRQEDGAQYLVWETEKSSRTNDEGVGWVVQNIELKEGWWQVGCRDADLVAELFGENLQNCATFQVIAVQNSPAMAPPPVASSSDAIAGSRPSMSKGVSDPPGLWQDAASDPAEPTELTPPILQSVRSEADAETGGGSRPQSWPMEDFTLGQSQVTALPGEDPVLTGYSRKSGQLRITVRTQASSPFQEVQRIELPPGAQIQSFCVRLSLPQAWFDNAIVGIAELHPDDGSAILSRGFSVTAKSQPEFERTDGSPSLSFKVTQPQAASADEGSSGPIFAAVGGQDTNQLESGVLLQGVADLNVADPWEGTPSDMPKPSVDWNPELRDDDLLPPKIAFASSRSPDRTFCRLLALVSSSAAAEVSQQRYSLINQRNKAVNGGVQEGIVGQVIAVPASRPLPNPVDSERVPARDFAATIDPVKSFISEDPPASNPFSSVPTQPVSSTPQARDRLLQSEAAPLALDLPESLCAGDLVGVVVRLTGSFRPACIQLWVNDSDTDAIVDGPRWILDFAEDSRGRTGITHFTVPSCVESLQFKAIAYRELPPFNGSSPENYTPAASVTVHRRISQR